MSILRKGMQGAPVKRLQAKLGVEADGVFGPATERSLRDFQESAGLAVDGIAGPDTFTAIGLSDLVLLRRGTRGETVKRLQTALGIDADGRFGPATEAAVKTFQARNGLDMDGQAGPETLTKLDAFAEITEKTVAEAVLRPDEQVFGGEPMPELDGSKVIAGSTTAPPKKQSVWTRVKGLFS